MVRSVTRFLSCAEFSAFALFLTAQGVYGSLTEVTPLPPPKTPLASQDRTALKHRQPPLLYSATLATVPQIVALNQQLPAGVNTSASIRQSNTAISPYETKVFTVDGDLWLVKMQNNDNDYHVEIGPRGGGPTANRIVVEIPADPAYAGTRRALLSLLPGNYVFQRTMTRNFKTPIPIRVTGYAFYDGAHWTKNDVQGHNHGSAFTATLWEIHPVWKIERAP
ncbi:MAG TPA: hypothetical protein VGU64_05120 [Terriglobales bacterium]|nr:hypothetical protein [Terriglobales bacterium]